MNLVLNAMSNTRKLLIILGMGAGYLKINSN